jgi:WD40 repeat protein
MWEVASKRVVRRFFLGKAVWSVGLSGDGRRPLFLYEDGLRRMELWDLQDARKLRPLGGAGHWGGVVMSADGRRALSCDGFDGRVRLWDLDKGEELCSRPDNEGEAYCVALSPNGRQALAGHHGAVTLYDVVSGQIVERLREKHGRILAVAFSPDGSRFAYGDDSGKLHLFRTKPLERRWSQQAHSAFLRALVFSRDGQRLYSGGGHPITTTVSREVGAIRIWDAATGQPTGVLFGHTEAVQSLALSPDGAQLLSGAGSGARKDCTVRLWDRLRDQELKHFVDHKTPVTSVAFAPDGKWFVSASYSQTFLWDLKATSGKARHDLTVRGTRALAFVGNRQVITAENDRQLVVCGAERVAISGGFLPHLVNGLALSADGKHMATANSNGTVYILRLPLGKR